MLRGRCVDVVTLSRTIVIALVTIAIGDGYHQEGLASDPWKKLAARDGKKESSGAGTICFTPDGSTLVVTWGENIETWDVKTRKIRTVIGKHEDYIYYSSLAPDGNILASTTRDRSIKLWDISKRRLLYTLPKCPSSIECIDFSPDNILIAYSMIDGSIIVWNRKTTKQFASFTRDTRPYSIRFSPDGKLLACSGADGTVVIWNIKSKKVAYSFVAHGAEVISLAFSPNGRTLATGGWDSLIKLWDLARNKELASFKCDADRVSEILFSPDGKILTATDHDTVKIWDAKTYKMRGSTKAHKTGVTIAFSKDGKLFASADGYEVRLWDTSARPFAEQPLKGETIKEDAKHK